MWRCPRSISTVVCVHEPGCDPPDCSGHGLCVSGRCRCHGAFWAGPACDTLDCGPANCSLHGVCSAGEYPRGISPLVGGAASPLLQPLLVRTRVLQEPAEGLGRGLGLETSNSVPQFPFLPQSCALSFL